VYQVFDGSGRASVGDHAWSVTRGDLFVVPSWQPFSVTSEASSSDSDSGALDLFQFSDAPIFSKLNLFKTLVEDPR
jgi:gentisate 1,2-dioxygenase